MIPSTEREHKLVKEAVDDVFLDFYQVLSGTSIIDVSPQIERIRKLINQAETIKN